MRLIIITLLFFVVSNLYAQKILNDFSFTLHEETVNKVLSAIGQVSGTNDYEVLFISGKYHWTIINPQIQIRPDSSQFTCDALVTVGPFSYSTQVNGHSKIYYDKVKDKIEIKIVRAIFELYTVVFDKKIHIKDIHLEDHFKDPFLFDGPKAYGTTMDLSLPDSVHKRIYLQPTDCELKIQWQKVTTDCEILVTDKPPVVLKPAANTNKSTAKPTTTVKPNTTKTNTMAAQKK